MINIITLIINYCVFLVTSLIFVDMGYDYHTWQFWVIVPIITIVFYNCVIHYMQECDEEVIDSGGSTDSENVNNKI